MELIPENIRRFWNGWQIRGVVLLGLCSAIILTKFGSRRNSQQELRYESYLWIAYKAPNWAASADFDDQFSLKKKNEIGNWRLRHIFLCFCPSRLLNLSSFSCISIGWHLDNLIAVGTWNYPIFPCVFAFYITINK